jgi:hypothetical protein
MNDPRIYADFHNADSKGRVRLTCVGTIEDLARQGIRLVEGLPIVLHDEELEAEGVVEYSRDEGSWVASIDWDAIRAISSP